MKAFTKLFFLLFLILLAVFWFGKNDLGNFISFEIQRDAIEHNGNTNSGNNEEDTDESSDFDGWSFAVIGDTEDRSSVNEKMVEDMGTRDIDFVVHLGDIAQRFDEGDPQAVVNLFADELTVPTYYIIGNNDLVYDEEIERKTRNAWVSMMKNVDSTDGLYYSVEHENAHLIFLDNSYLRDGFPDDELNWLTEELDRTQPFDLVKQGLPPERVPTIDNTFVFFHRPLDVPGQQLFGDDETPNSRIQNEAFKEIIADADITRIFNGHLHTTLNYRLGAAPVTVSGGGGAIPQRILGGEDAAFYHYYLVHVPYDGGEPELELVEYENL